MRRKNLNTGVCLKAARVCCAGLLLFLLPSNATYSQNVNETVTFEDMGFTLPLNVGARPAGLSGAYTAIGNDVHALVYNPAGLARIKRIELSAGFQQEYKDAENAYYGTQASVNSRDAGTDVLSAAYPFPTYRGSFVAAVGVYRIFSGFFDLRHNGQNTRTDTIDNFLLQQTGSVYSYNFGLGVDLSPTLSGGFSLFTIDGTIDALKQYDYTLLHTIPRKTVYVKEDCSLDLTGYGGRIGAQFFVHPKLKGGASFTTPIWIAAKGGGATETSEYIDNEVGVYSTEPVFVEDKYLIPYRIDFGVAFSDKFFLIAVEAGYSDWTEAAVNRKRFRNALETIFKEVLDYRLGAEFSIPWLPLRIRAGYAYRPYPLKYLQGERIDDVEKYSRGYGLDTDRLEKSSVDSEQQQFSLGAGWSVGSTLVFDAAFAFLRGERSTDPLTDDRSATRFLLGASYRF